MTTQPDRIEKRVFLRAPRERVWRAITDSGVILTITESGFDHLPVDRRGKAFAANEGGWAAQCELIAKHLAHGAR